MLVDSVDGEEWVLWRQNLAWRPRWVMGVGRALAEFGESAMDLPERAPFESMERHQNGQLVHLAIHLALLIVTPIPAILEILCALVLWPFWYAVRRVLGRGRVVHVFAMPRWVEAREMGSMSDVDELIRALRDGSYQRVSQDFSSLLVQRPGRVVRTRR